MATEDALRQRVRDLLALGLTQKAIAAAIKRSESWVTRWLQEKQGVNLEVREMDSLNQFFERLAATALGKNNNNPRQFAIPASR